MALQKPKQLSYRLWLMLAVLSISLLGHSQVALAADGNFDAFMEGDEAAAAPSQSSQTVSPTTQATMSVINKANQTVAHTGRTDCAICGSPAERRVGQNSPTLRPIRDRGMAPACSQLMNSSGDLGPIGQKVYSDMSSYGNEKQNPFLRDGSLGVFCPKFNQLNDEERLTAWAWFWTSLAQEESSCKVNVVHPTTYQDRDGNTHFLNPYQGYGLWAMESSPNLRATRGPDCRGSIANVSVQASCAVHIMEQQLTHYRSASTDAETYWGPIRNDRNYLSRSRYSPRQEKIIPHMRRLSLCF